MVFLANDWHAGLVPTYIAGKYRQHGVYKVRPMNHGIAYLVIARRPARIRTSTCTDFLTSLQLQQQPLE